jgi:hypothetical protein
MVTVTASATTERPAVFASSMQESSSVILEVG